MPAAIPLVIAGATMVASNMQQKAALKNNENQQAASVQNAQGASNAAFQRQNQWLQSNPAPFSHGFNLAPPPGGAPQATLSAPSTQSIMQGAFSRGTPDAPWSNFNHALSQGVAPGTAGFHPSAFGSPQALLGGNPAPHPPAPIGSGTGTVLPNGHPGYALQPPQTLSPQMLMQRVQQLMTPAGGA